MIFSDSPQQRALERMMTAVPRFRPKGGGIMVLHHFEYTAEMCDCRYCPCLPSQLQQKHRRQARRRKPNRHENRKPQGRRKRPSRPNRQNLRSRMLRVSRRSRKSPWKHSRSRQNLRNHRKKRNSPSQRSLLLRLRRPNPRQPNRLLQQSLPRRLNLLLRSKQSLLLKRSPRPHTIMNSTSMRSEPTASPSVRA